MKDVFSRAKADLPTLVELRRTFHRHPELSMQEVQTAQRIETELDRLGIPHSRVGGTGVLGVIHGSRPGSHVIALRADIDALPIQETASVPYCSQVDGVMHACGHDAHTACLLGAAKLLSEDRDNFGGEVRLIFQPGEEIGQGAEDFIEAGALDGVERVFGLHTAHEIPAGTVSLTPGINNAAVDQFRIVIQGKAAHVSTPQLGADAVYIGSLIVNAVQALVTRRSSPVEPVLVGIGTFHSGTTYNALADSAVLEGTTRTITKEMRQQLRRDITTLCRETAQLYGGSAEVQWNGICSALWNDAQVCQEAVDTLSDLMPEVTFRQDRPLSLAGDNFAELNQTIAGAYAYLGSGNPAKPDTLNPAHNGKFNLDEDTLAIGAALYAGYARRWLDQEVTG